MKIKLDKSEVRWTSDTHFYHSNIIKYDDGPFWSDKAKELDRQAKYAYEKGDTDLEKEFRGEERKELELNALEQKDTIIENWNRVVDPDQTVIHLGDFAFMPYEQRNNRDLVEDRCLEILEQLNGRIILIRGNHEQAVDRIPSVASKFWQIRDYLEITVDGQRINMLHYPIHEWNQCHRGAWMLHGHTHKNDDYDNQFKICNLGCMNWNYTPVSFEQLQIYMAAKNIKTH